MSLTPIYRTVLGVAVAASMALPHTAAAQTRGPLCKDRDLAEQNLGEQFGEQLVGYGLMSNGHLMELFASDATGTWTVLITSPSGVSCMKAAGQIWQPAPKAAPGAPS